MDMQQSGLKPTLAECEMPRGSAGQEGLGLVQAMLEVAAFPEDSICAISFNFWHRLSRLLTSDPPGQPLQLLPARSCSSQMMHRLRLGVSSLHHAAGRSTTTASGAEQAQQMGHLWTPRCRRRPYPSTSCKPSSSWSTWCGGASATLTTSSRGTAMTRTSSSARALPLATRSWTQQVN